MSILTHFYSPDKSIDPILPGFEDLPVLDLPPFKSKSLIRYYLCVQSTTGHWYFLWKTHSNGGQHWVACDTDSRKRPLRYKTIGGAQRALRDYTAGRELLDAKVLIWQGGAV